MGVIDVNSYRLREAGNDIIMLTKEINEILNNIFTMIENMPTKTNEWMGYAAEDFARVAKLEKKDYSTFINNIDKYGKYLIEYSNKVEQLAMKVDK